MEFPPDSIGSPRFAFGVVVCEDKLYGVGCFLGGTEYNALDCVDVYGFYRRDMKHG